MASDLDRNTAWLTGCPRFCTLVIAVVVHEFIRPPAESLAPYSSPKETEGLLHCDHLVVSGRGRLRRISTVLLDQARTLIAAPENFLEDLLDALGRL
jgi:hypothetical protein